MRELIDMKDGIYAVYLGKEYTSGKIPDGRIVLRSTNIEDVQNGFEVCEPFQYRECKENIVCIKIVNRSEVEAYYRVRTQAIYMGFKFDVIQEHKNKISIVSMTGDYRTWLQLGMICTDKGVYQKWIDRNDAQIIVVKEDL